MKTTRKWNMGFGRNLFLMGMLALMCALGLAVAGCDDGNNGGGGDTTSSITVSTLAGDGTMGYADGTGTTAKFSRPEGVAVDSTGNVYVADTDNNRIRKITPSGVVTTLAGDGTMGYADGTGTAAKLSGLRGVAVDSAGNVYVADSGNRIRKITPLGVVTTLAGDGTQGYADGTGTTAKFNDLRGVAVDSAGIVYVLDYGNHRIRKITPLGVVTTLAGDGTTGSYADGTGTAAKFNQPQGVAVDSAGNVYVADTGNGSIRKITPEGVVTTLVGGWGSIGYADGTGTAAKFTVLAKVTVDSEGIVYVVDSNRIRKITQ
jgi:sugar lactone lactonase YvrE